MTLYLFSRRAPAFSRFGFGGRNDCSQLIYDKDGALVRIELFDKDIEN
jgi:hypothetical protein